MPLKVYDHTIEVLKSAVRKAKLGEAGELAAMRRLDEEARRLEPHAAGPAVEALFAEGRLRSHNYGGWSVFGEEPPADATSGTLAEIGRRPKPAFNRSGEVRVGR